MQKKIMAENIFFNFTLTLSLNKVENCFTNDLVSIQPDDERLQKFTEHLLKGYIHPKYIWIYTRFKKYIQIVVHIKMRSSKGKIRNFKMSEKYFENQKRQKKYLEK